MARRLAVETPCVRRGQVAQCRRIAPVHRDIFKVERPCSQGLYVNRDRRTDRTECGMLMHNLATALPPELSLT